jgi:hypothetical protein
MGWSALSEPSMTLTWKGLVTVLMFTAAAKPARVPAAPRFTTSVPLPPLTVSGAPAEVPRTLTASLPVPVFRMTGSPAVEGGVLTIVQVMLPTPPLMVSPRRAFAPMMLIVPVPVPPVSPVRLAPFWLVLSITLGWLKSSLPPLMVTRVWTRLRFSVPVIWLRSPLPTFTESNPRPAPKTLKSPLADSHQSGPPRRAGAAGCEGTG